MADESADKNQTTIAAINELIRNSATELGLKPHFIDELVTASDDWSFVIKTHALLEAISCSMLAHGVGRPELETVFAEQVEMSARIKLLETLNLLSKEEARLCRRLGELRNQVVHNAKMTSFTFKDDLGNADKRKAFLETVGALVGEDVQNAFADNPRILMWASVVLLSVKSMHNKKQAEQEKAQRTLQAAILGLSRAMKESEKK